MKKLILLCLMLVCAHQASAQGALPSNLYQQCGGSTPCVFPGNPVTVTTADFIHVQNSGIFNGFTEILTWRILDPSGTPHNYNQSFTINAGTGGATTCVGGVGNDNCSIQMAINGTLVSVSAGNSSGPMPGTDYFEVFLLKQAAYNGDPTQIVATLISTYMESANVVFWPGGRAIVSIQDIPGEGNPVWGTGTSPAAGADFSCTPIIVGNCSGGGGTQFGNANLVLDSIYFTYTSSAQAATRQISFEVGAGAPTIIHIPAPATQAASLTVNYTFCSGCTSSTVDAANVVVALPTNLFLNQQQSGFIWRTKTTNIQTSDTITNVQFRVRQKGTW